MNNWTQLMTTAKLVQQETQSLITITRLPTDKVLVLFRSIEDHNYEWRRSFNTVAEAEEKLLEEKGESIL